jgi:DeoR/GlpR family transcriptional regulator of sugar metabolism
MEQGKRNRIIIETINNYDFISVNEILNKCNVSEITARRDLALLESKNLIKRTHGGAVKSKATDNLFSYCLKSIKTPNKN